MADLSALPGYHRDYQMLTSRVLLDALHLQDEKNTYTEADFPNIRTLFLQNMNICTVSNISDFTHLAKLVLSNNAIERLTGLDELTNLEVLDVSFNKLQSLDGVERLVKLMDLSANNNDIMDISGLLKMSETYKQMIGLSQASHPLELLNLQNNALPGPLKVTIKILQSFKSLEIVVLTGNEFSKEHMANLQLYRKEALAFLPSLKYLDFQAVLPDERQKATDQYKTELITLEEREQLEQKALQQALQRSRQIRIDAVADCLGFDNLVDTELLTGDANEKVFLIPAVKMEAVGWFRTEAIEQLRNFSKIMRRRRVLREGEISEFEEFYEVLTDDLASEQRKILKDYYIEKDFILNGGEERRFEKSQEILAQKAASCRDKAIMNSMAETTQNQQQNPETPEDQTNESDEAMNEVTVASNAEEPSESPATGLEQAEQEEVDDSLQQSTEVDEKADETPDLDAPDIIYNEDPEESLKELVDEGGDLEFSDLIKKFDDVAPLAPLRQYEEGPEPEQDEQGEEPENNVGPSETNLTIEERLKKWLINLLELAESQILQQETEVEYEIQEGIDALSTALQALENKTVEMAESCFQQFKALLNQLNEKSTDLLHKALELKLWKEAQSNAAKEEAQDTIAEAVDLTLQDEGAQEEEQQEVQNLLPAEMTPEVMSLLKDKAAIATAAMNAHEHKSSLIDVREDNLIASQKEAIDSAMKVIQGCEFERVRRRMLEIEEWYLREKEFAEKAAL